MTLNPRLGFGVAGYLKAGGWRGARWLSFGDGRASAPVVTRGDRCSCVRARVRLVLYAQLFELDWVSEQP
jgi:hypothetical protein